MLGSLDITLIIENGERFILAYIPYYQIIRMLLINEQLLSLNAAIFAEPVGTRSSSASSN